MLLAAKENGEDDEDGSGQESDSQMSGSRSKARTGETGSAQSARDHSVETGTKKGSMKASDRQGSMSESQEDENSEDLDNEDDGEFNDEIGDLPSQPEMKRELAAAIEEERREYEVLRKQNEDLQRKIILNDTSNRADERQTDQLLSEHKYLNTLANVH